MNGLFPLGVPLILIQLPPISSIGDGEPLAHATTPSKANPANMVTNRDENRKSTTRLPYNRAQFLVMDTPPP